MKEMKNAAAHQPCSSIIILAIPFDQDSKVIIWNNE